MKTTRDNDLSPCDAMSKRENNNPTTRTMPGWLAVAVLLLAGGAVFAQTPYYVDAARPDDSGNGLTWGTAKQTIQAAVNLTAAGDTVWVTNGTYQIAAQVDITNGITVRGVNGAAVTIVDGGGVRRGFNLSHTDGVIDGFTITNGVAASGGGIYLTDGLVRNCIITDCRVNNHTHGGGIYMTGGTVSNSVIRNNRATTGTAHGGGIRAQGGGTIIDCIVSGNQCNVDGGGIYASTADVLIRNCLVVGNRGREGGGIYGGTVESSTMVDNVASVRGGGTRGSTVINSIVVGNQAIGYPLTRNYHLGAMTYSLATPMPTGTGNLDATPRFVDAAAGNYRLLPGSPAIDAGLDQAWMTGATDLDGNPRLFGTVDMGAHEHTDGVLRCHFTVDAPIGPVPHTVVFSAHVDGTNTTDLSYGWDFNNNGTFDLSGSDLATVTNTYHVMGVYTVRLQVANAAGETATRLRQDSVVVHGGTAHVWSDSPDPSAPYATWATAAHSVQDAIDAMSDGALVLVTNGVYPLDAQLMIEKGVTVRSVNGAAQTLLDGGGARRCVYMGHADAVLDGFTLTNGVGGAIFGGGLFMDDGTLQNSVVVDCGVGNHQSGGGIAMTGGTVSNSVVENCTATVGSGSGGGIHATGGGIVNCVVRDNRCNANGGGVNAAASVLIRNCLVAGNSSSEGGGIHGGTVESCTVANNRAGTRGGGTRNSTVLNSIVWGNQATSYPAESDYGGGSLTFSCTLPLPSGAGNIDTDPQFVDPAGGDFRLLPGSPAMNAGTNQVWMANAFDLDGQPRITGDDCDMGAYEYLAGPLQGNFLANPFEGMAPLQVVFTAHVDGTNTTGLSYGWDFEDSGDFDLWGGSYAVVTNGYHEPGIYSVRLVVSNAAGEVSERRRDQYISALSSTAYVWPGSPDPAPPYTSWATAAHTIQEAIDAVSDGVTILVTNGTYLLGAHVLIDKAITVRSVNGAGVTLLDGNNSVRGVYMDHADAVLDGFTVTNGYPGAAFGGGIFLANGLIKNCVVTDCGVGNHQSGGGIAMTGGTVSNSVVENCTATVGSGSGGGIHATGGGIVNCVVRDNRCNANGGGVNAAASVLIRNCLVTGNSSADGGGIHGGTVESCTVANNRAGTRGGGARNSTVLNSVVWGNQATSYPGESDYGGGSLTFSCTLPLPAGAGNIDTDPQFVDPAAGDFRLLPGSPSMNAGANQAWMTGAFDLDGQPRITGDDCDMGAYEYPAGTLACNLTGVPLKGRAPHTVVFTAHVEGLNTNGMIFGWDFTADGVWDRWGPEFTEVTHVYQNPGLYSITLIVSNAAGETATRLRETYIRVHAATTHVWSGGAAIAPYTCWDTAAQTIQDAVDVVADGATVLVADGLYALTSQIVMDQGVTVRSVNGAAHTILDGGGSHRGVYMDHADAVLDGFTITNGYRGLAFGGGIYLAAGQIINCVVTDCGVGNHLSGGGIFMTGGTVANSVIEGCRATVGSAHGGGIRASAGRIIACILRDNRCNNNGGGIHALAGVLVRNSLIVGNTASEGGGIHGGTVENCTIADNTAGSRGGGTRNSSVTNSIVYGNQATAVPAENNYGGGTFTYSCTTPLPPGVGNIDDDPLFADAAAGDYRLQKRPIRSPGIDAGMNQDWMTGATDLDGNPRIRRGRIHEALPEIVDMGAFEYNAPRKGMFLMLK